MNALPELLSELGEKAIIREIVRPMLNPTGSLDSVGDDCALISIPNGAVVCASTDRVPADLVSFRLGIIDYRGLGNYLAILNLSDLAAMGATPAGLLLNLGLPHDMCTADFVALLEGARDACAKHDCKIVGGDLSSSSELSISATSIGTLKLPAVLRRYGAKVGDVVYCTDLLGLSATAFAYFLRAKPRGLRLNTTDENLLKDCFRRPRPRFDAGQVLAASDHRITAMDNTDGAAQSLSEIAELAGVGLDLTSTSFPVHDVSQVIAEYLEISIEDVILGPGADFQLLGTFEPGALSDTAIAALVYPIGVVVEEPGIRLVNADQKRVPFRVRGWDYYAAVEIDHTKPSAEG